MSDSTAFHTQLARIGYHVLKHGNHAEDFAVGFHGYLHDELIVMLEHATELEHGNPKPPSPDEPSILEVIEDKHRQLGQLIMQETTLVQTQERQGRDHVLVFNENRTFDRIRQLRMELRRLQHQLNEAKAGRYVTAT